ncbi:MAG TPA: OsmC family peroxiredoxin [Candidatus Kapabacteria bacterium]|nr:OsmC family peroxiredoxin [Candidatus Kapabacteria bacterium]
MATLFNRRASAKWNGTGKDGKGQVATETKAIDVAYNWNNRFGEGTGTNPEEMLAAAHASCFSMKLAFVLDSMGMTAEEINTNVKLTIDKAPGDWTVTKSAITVTAKIPNGDAAKLQEAAENAKANCPISRAIKAEMTVEAKLV